jgi:cold shock CspA family protein
MNGEIIRIVADKSFGFIQGDDGLPYFVHRSACRGAVVFDDLRDGQRVTFMLSLRYEQLLRLDD